MVAIESLHNGFDHHHRDHHNDGDGIINETFRKKQGSQ